MNNIQKNQLQPVIVTKIMDGLGNQMFQYAIARRLAHVTGGHLILMLEDNFEIVVGRKLGLIYFNIVGNFTYRAMLEATLDSMFPQHQELKLEHIAKEKTIGDYLPLAGTAQLAAKRDLFFIPDILDWRDSLLLDGNWQDERYFADIADIIRQDFTLRVPFDQRNREALGQIQGGPSMFVHVRRGDYLQPKWSQSLGGPVGADYFHRAISIIRARVGHHVKAFVFSDDPDWARSNLIGGPDAQFIDWNGDAPEQDICLMSACQHAVLSNSSFSWWGAWLGERPGSLIIAPKPWFRTLPEHDEIIPQRWLRL